MFVAVSVLHTMQVLTGEIGLFVVKGSSVVVWVNRGMFLCLSELLVNHR